VHKTVKVISLCPVHKTVNACARRCTYCVCLCVVGPGPPHYALLAQEPEARKSYLAAKKHREYTHCYVII